MTEKQPLPQPTAPAPPLEAYESDLDVRGSRLVGALLCSLSAAGFASLTVLGKIALNNGLSLATILALRFGGAALILFIYLALIQKRSLFPGMRLALILFALGALGYAGQSTLYFASLDRNPASVNGILLYVYPVFVALIGWLVNRTPPTNREWLAMALALFGVLLTVRQPGGDLGFAQADPIGVFLVIGSALWYSVYIVTSDRVVHQPGAWLSTAWISLGASFSFTVFGGVLGLLNFNLSVQAIWILVAMVFVSTILALGTFFAGMRIVGPTAASLLSTLEPVFTVLLAMLALSERLALMQLLGGLFVLTAVILLTLPERSRPRTE
ncbi:MAG: EamA family transporter [Anaerolineales bacterium]|jgi:drug/metabolite transporter (DMT)-like permease